jgi:hypothetical protein
MNDMPQTCTAFDGHRRLHGGPLAEVALAVAQAVRDGAAGPVLVYDDSSGRVVDIDTRGSDRQILARLPQPAADANQPGEDPEGPRGRGRPKLGVIAREVTLLPRHWDWLNQQAGGASVALRKMVEEARRINADQDRRRRQREAAYCFMSAIAGDLPGFEEASRALFTDDAARFREQIAGWPEDLASHTLKMAFPDGTP